MIAPSGFTWTPLSGPSPRWLYVGDRCQNACGFCAARQVTYPTHIYDFAAAVADLKRESAAWVVIGGQEPTLLSVLPDLVRMLKKAEIGRITLESNLIAMTPGLLTSLLAEGLDEIHFLSLVSPEDTVGVPPENRAAMARGLAHCLDHRPGALRALVPAEPQSMKMMAGHAERLGGLGVTAVLVDLGKTPVMAPEMPGIWRLQAESFFVLTRQ